MSDVLSFDISKNPKGNPITYGRVGDTNGLTRKVKVYEDGKPLDLTGYVITFEGNTSKYKTKVFDTDGISIVDAAKGEFNYTFPNMAFAVEGQYERAYFSFANATKRLTTADFQVIVFGNSDIDAEEAETIITEYNKLVKELHEMQDQYIEGTDQRFLELNERIDELNSQFEKLKLDLKLSKAWAWSEDGTDRFTTVYPNENLLSQSNTIEKKWIDSGGTIIDLANGFISEFLPVNVGETYTLTQVETDPTVGVVAVYDSNKQFISRPYANNGPVYKFSINVANAAFIRIAEKSSTGKLKEGIKLEHGNVQTIYTPAPSDDPLNSFPHYQGYSLIASNEPSDYVWQHSNEYISYQEQLYAAKDNVYTKSESDERYATDQDIANLTKTDVGLSNVENYVIASDADAAAGVTSNSYMTPKKTALAVEKQVFNGADGSLQYIAHRGSNADYPENTVLAFEAVTRHWGIETDIQVTSDGTWICMHDSTVDRTTDGTGTVASKTLAQIKALKIDTGNNLAALTDAQKQVPTFEEYLTVCKKNQRVPIIEIKTGNYSAANYDSVVTSLVKFNLTQVAVFISFDRQALVEIKKRLPAVPVQYLVNSVTDQVIADAKALGTNAGVSVSYNDASVTTANVIKIHNANLSAACWTVPDTKFDEMVAMGFDYITTNSKSGNRRWAEVTLGTGIIAESISKVGPSCVEETEDGGLHLHFAIRGGDNVKGTVFLTLPNWAIPMWSKWLVCTIRTSGGTATASFDITGIAEGASVSSLNAGEVKTSYGWDARTNWVAADVKYSKY